MDVQIILLMSVKLMPQASDSGSASVPSYSSVAREMPQIPRIAPFCHLRYWCIWWSAFLTRQAPLETTWYWCIFYRDVFKITKWLYKQGLTRAHRFQLDYVHHFIQKRTICWTEWISFWTFTFHDDNIWAFMIELGFIPQSRAVAKLTDFKLAANLELGRATDFEPSPIWSLAWWLI